MRLPRMTTRYWIVTVLVLAVWLGFVARAQRLRGIGSSYMRLYTRETRRAFELREQRKTEEATGVRSHAASYLRRAEQFNVEADFVESFTVALLGSAFAFGCAVFVRNRRRPTAQRGVGVNPHDGR